MTLESFIAWETDHAATLGTLKKHRQLRNRICETVLNPSLEQLTRYELRAIVYNDSFSPNQQRQIASFLRSYLRWAFRMGLVTTDNSSWVPSVTARTHPVRYGPQPLPIPSELTQFHKWLQHQPLSRSTVSQRINHLRYLVAEYKSNPAKLTSNEVNSFFSARWGTKSKNYLSAIRSSFKVFYLWAFNEGDCPDGLLIANDLPRITRSQPRPHPAPTKLVLAGFEIATLPERLLLLLGSTGGLRRSEIAKVHPRDLSGKWLRVTGKGNKTRRIPIRNDVLATMKELERQQGRDSYYFPGAHGPGTHIHSATIGKWARRLLNELASTHSLRHLAATTWQHNNISLRVIQELLGHASVSTTQIYTDVTDSDLIDAVENNPTLTPQQSLEPQTTVTVDLNTVTIDEANAILQAAIRLATTAA